MKFFALLKKETIHLATQQKIIPKEQLETLLNAEELLEKVKEDEKEYRKKIAKECEQLKEGAVTSGFEEGLKRWNQKLQDLEKEIANVRIEMENSLVPLAMAAIKKIIGREIELKPETIVDIVSTSLKTLSHHRRIKIFVHKNDVELLESQRPTLKALFEHLQALAITSREDLKPGECIIETESGIINVSWELQLKALETAFHSFLQERGKT